MINVKYSYAQLVLKKYKKMNNAVNMSEIYSPGGTNVKIMILSLKIIPWLLLHMLQNKSEIWQLTRKFVSCW